MSSGLLFFAFFVCLHRVANSSKLRFRLFSRWHVFRVFVAEVTPSAPCKRALKAVVAFETAVTEIDLFIPSVYAVIVLGSLIGFTVVSAIRRLSRGQTPSLLSCG